LLRPNQQIFTVSNNRKSMMIFTINREGKNTKEDILKQNARIEKWRKMMPSIGKLMANNDDKLKNRLRKGIPDGIRMLIWPLLAEVD